MTDKLIQALEAAALAATTGDWTPDDNFCFTVQCYRTGLDRLLATVNGPNAENDTRFIALASPQNILRVLADRDADKALIAELSSHLRNAHAFIENTEAFGGEAATGIISCGGAEWNIDASKAALSNSPKGARTLTVKLPPVSFFDFKLGSAFASGAYVNVEAMNKALAAAGITLVVGE